MYVLITCDYFEVVRKCRTASNQYYKYIKCMYSLLVIILKLFESVELLQTSIITILDVCTHYL